MKKRILSLIVAGLLVAGFATVPVYALVKSDDTLVIGTDEVIDDDLFATGSEVIIEGTVNGDVYVGASRLVIRGTVNGDVIAGASTIEVTGTIRDDLRAGANTVSLVGATVGDSVTVGGNELSINGESSIGGGLIFGGRLLSIDGSVGRGITSGSQSTRINGDVGRTVRVAADTLTIGSSASVNGDLEYNSENEAQISGQISGEVRRSEASFSVNTEGFMRALTVGFSVWAFMGAAVVAGVLVMLLPNALRRSDKQFMERPWSLVGRGSLAFLASLPAIFLLMLTVIGIPLAIVWLTIWVLAIYMAKFFVAYSLGTLFLSRFASEKDTKPLMYLAVVIGLALYYGLRLLPVAGMFIRFATTVVGIGMMLSLYTLKNSKPSSKSSRA